MLCGETHAATDHWAANLSGAEMISMNRSGNASNRACASPLKAMPFSRNKGHSVAFLLPTQETPRQG